MGHGEGKALQERLEPLPSEATPLAPSAKPLEPDAWHCLHQTLKTSQIAIHSKVIEVSSDPPHERCVLRLDRGVPVAVLFYQAWQAPLVRPYPGA